jgi:endothelin-converting enzyme
MRPLTEVAANFSVVDQMRKWQKLGRTRNHLEWEMYASTVNAYFNPPACVKLQWDFVYVAYISPDKRSFFQLESCDHPGTMFNGQLSRSIVAPIKFPFDRPGYLNYGGMGAIAAHELTVRFFPNP